MNNLALTNLNIDPLSLDPLPPETRKRLLRFPLGEQNSALLPLEQITEIITLNLSQIMPLPEMPSCILGIGNWRGEMLWLVDLNQLVGCTPLWQLVKVSTSPVAMVIEIDNQFMGLVVQHVNDIELQEIEQLQPAKAGLFPAQLLPFILGVLPGGKGPILDIKAISQSPLWQAERR